ncbi:SMI1/KNR4 family protein [Streptomyces sp. SAS_260]
MDFEPFAAFLSAEETTDWFQAWTGNGERDGDDFRVIGQDGSGGYAACRLARPSQPLADQPVVFHGLEGRAALSRDLDDVLRLLARGFGSWEAVASHEPACTPRPDQELTAVAERFAPDRRRSPAAVIELAAQEFPDSDETLVVLCR